jgi:hypothetical protein
MSLRGYEITRESPASSSWFASVFLAQSPFPEALDQHFDLVAVGAVVEADDAVLVDGEIVHLVGEGWSALVLCRAPIISAIAVTSRFLSLPVALYLSSIFVPPFCA